MKIRNIFFILIIFTVFFTVGMISTNANTVNALPNVCVSKCSDVVGTSDFRYYLDITFKFIQYVAPILVIVFSTVDYFKAFFSGDADALKQVNKKTIIRLICAVLLFVLPILIRTILSIFGISTDCGVAGL